MPDIRASRVVGEALLSEGLQPSVGRVNVEVAGAMRETNTASEVRASRVVGEVVFQEPTSAGVTRVDVEVVAEALGANASATMSASRVVGEVLHGIIPIANVTRVDVEVAGALRGPGASDIRASRIAIDVLSRQGSAGPVTPLTLNPLSEFFLHNWVDGARLSSSYSTAIAQSPKTGAESRRGLVLKPTREIEVFWQGCDEDKVRRMFDQMRHLTDQRLQIPLYMDQREVDRAYLASDTTIFVDTSTARYFPGARVIIVEIGGNNQAASWSWHTIASTTSDSIELTAPVGVPVSASALVFPVLDVEVTLELDSDMSTSLVAGLSMLLTEVPGANALPPLKSDNPSGFPTFDDRPIFTVEPNWIRGITRGRRRQGQQRAQGRGFSTFRGATRSREYHEFQLGGKRERMWPVVEFFDTRRGALRSFFLIDQDQTLNTAELDASGNFVSVSETGDFAAFNVEWDYVGIVMENGDVYVRQVVNVQEVLTVYRLTVTPALPSGLNPLNVARVARARVTRFEEDTMEETWETDGYMETELSFIETLDDRDYTI